MLFQHFIRMVGVEVVHDLCPRVQERLKVIISWEGQGLERTHIMLMAHLGVEGVLPEH